MLLLVYHYLFTATCLALLVYRPAFSKQSQLHCRVWASWSVLQRLDSLGYG